MLSKACDNIENEFEQISRQRMADAIHSVVGGHQTYGGAHNAISVVAPSCREWKAMSDGSLRNGAEFVTPILGWDDLPTYQEVIRALRRAGAKTPSTMGRRTLRMSCPTVGRRRPAVYSRPSRISTAWHGIEKEAQESFLPYSTSSRNII